MAGLAIVVDDLKWTINWSIVNAPRSDMTPGPRPDHASSMRQTKMTPPSNSSPSPARAGEGRGGGSPEPANALHPPSQPPPVSWGRGKGSPGEARDHLVADQLD